MIKFIRLKDVCSYSGERISNSEVTLENFVTTDNLFQNKNGKGKAIGLPPSGNSMPMYSQENILVANIRPYLRKIWFADTQGGCSSDVLVFQVKKGFNPKFVYYAMFRDEFFEHTMKGSKGTKMPRGDKNQIMDFLIPSVELENQNKIAKVLSDLDAKIELNNKINKELEAMAKLIYDYWFVQFDFPNEEGKPYKSSGGKMVYNEELKRLIPDGWEVGTLDDISELTRGVTYSKDEIKSKDDTESIPILRATNISGNVIDLENMVYVPNDLVSKKQIMEKFDVIITMSSGSKEHIGKNGFYYFEKDVAFGAFCAKLTAKQNYRYYLYSYTQSDFMFATIKNESLGTNINNLNGAMVKGFKILIPPKNLISSFNDLVSSSYELIGVNTIQNKDLSSLRDWLLPMLMNGQVTVKEAEERIGMAAEPAIKYNKSNVKNK